MDSEHPPLTLEDDEEPILKYQKWSPTLCDTLGKDSVSCLAVSDRFLVNPVNSGDWNSQWSGSSDGFRWKWSEPFRMSYSICQPNQYRFLWRIYCFSK